MNRMRIYHTAVCSGASLFAMGGCDEDGVATDSVERLDLRMNGQWVEEAAMQINRTYAGSALISPDNMFW